MNSWVQCQQKKPLSGGRLNSPSDVHYSIMATNAEVAVHSHQHKRMLGYIQ